MAPARYNTHDGARLVARRGWLALDYDGSRDDGDRLTVRDGEPVMRFVRCPPDTPRFVDHRPLGPETAWAGGFIVARPGCATLRLRREGEPGWHDVRAGFGRRCARGRAA